MVKNVATLPSGSWITLKYVRTIGMEPVVHVLQKALRWDTLSLPS